MSDDIAGHLRLVASRFTTLVVCAALLCIAPASLLHAQTKLEAHYEATLAGLAIGTGNWIIEIGNAHYTAAANGKTAGLLRFITDGEGSSNAGGTFNSDKVSASTYSATIVSRKKSDEVRFTIHNGKVDELKLDPPPDEDPKRVPITEAHRQGVTDPMTASILRIPGSGEALSPEACRQNFAIFDGRLRYNLRLAFKRMDMVKAEKGYAGPVVVCAIYFSPLAGHIPSRTAIKYIAKSRDMEVWFAPIAGTRVLVPFRAQAPTPIGEAVLQATQFISVAVPSRASAATGAKVQ